MQRGTHKNSNCGFFFLVTIMSITIFVIISMLMIIGFMFPLYAFVPFVFITIYFLYSMRLKGDLPRTSTYLPFGIGNTLDLMNCGFNFGNFIKFLSKEKPDCSILEISILGTSFKVLQDPALVHDILRNKNWDEPMDGILMDTVKKILGEKSLILIPHHVGKKTNPEWKRDKTTLLKMMSSRNISKEKEKISHIVETVCRKRDGERNIDAKLLTNDITMDTFVKLFLRMEGDCQDFVDHFNYLNKIFIPFQLKEIVKQIMVIGPLVAKLLPSDHFLQDKKVVLTKLCKRLDNIEDNDVIKNLKGESSTENLAARMYAMFFAGYDSTSTSMRWGLYYLYNHPEYQKQLAAIIQEHYNPEDISCIEQEPLKTALNNLVNEITRIAPPTFMLVRRAKEDETLCEGISFTKGETVMLNVTGMHLNKKIWGENADCFVPDRWNDINEIQQKAYMAFGRGYRTCAGQQLARTEIILFFCILLSKYTFDVHDVDKIKNGTGILNNPSGMRITIKSI